MASPALKRSRAPDWHTNSRWSQNKPTGEWGRKSTDRWCLLPPYDPSITEDQWHTYYLERSSLDKINSSGGDRSWSITSHDLVLGTWKILRSSVGGAAAAILGSNLEEKCKKDIVRTMCGSLYITSMEGMDDENWEPRTIQTTTRLYSPFGIGTSVDMFYYYHWRSRNSGILEYGSMLFAISKTIGKCNSENPSLCTAFRFGGDGIEKAAVGGVTVFEGSDFGQRYSATEKNLKLFEKALFGCQGWLSPLKIANLLINASTALHYNEGSSEVPMRMTADLRFFQGEDDGKAAMRNEYSWWIEDEELGSDEDAEISIPQELLSLARN